MQGEKGEIAGVEGTIIQSRPAFLIKFPSANPQINCCVCKPPFPNARGIFVHNLRTACMASSRKCRISFARSFSSSRPRCMYGQQNQLSLGIEPGRGQVACTCSRYARCWSQRGSLLRDVRPHHSCSTSGLGCSHLLLVRAARGMKARILRDMWP